MSSEQIVLSRVFRDAGLHRKISAMIASHLSNRQDIREQALDGLDLSNAREVLDLGCGFGFFTEALGGKVHPGARVTGIDRFPEYEYFYYLACEKAGLRADFKSSGIETSRKLPSSSFDLIICSYAMYFFPGYISEISRILKDDGIFIAITHSLPHMEEFCSYVRGVLKENGLIVTIDLPYETLISQFSNLNGASLLKPWFGQVDAKPYLCNLVFGSGDHENLIDYFNFKHYFFIPEMIDPDDRLHANVIDHIRRDLKEKGGMKVSKNDTIFVCRSPKGHES